MVWYSHLLKNFPRFVVIHTVKGFGLVNKAEVMFFYDPMDVGNLISASPVFSKSRKDIWKFEHLEVLSLHTVEASLILLC